jgi:hypothetical protein
MLRFFSNGPRTHDYTENFFHQNAAGVASAQLACPFFTNCEPPRILVQKDCREIQLLVRLCVVTDPNALREARSISGVQIRYFTGQTFHAKFYLLGTRALVGSANLTGGGLRQNRELSVEITAGEAPFEELPALFDELWNSARVLTDDAFTKFEIWRRSHGPVEPQLDDGLPEASPPNVNVNSTKEDPVRTYLESFRQRYVEQILPAYSVVRAVYGTTDLRHPQLAKYPIKYEIDRFFYWVKEKTSDEALPGLPLRNGSDQSDFIRNHVREWVGVVGGAGYFNDAERIERIEHLNRIFESKQTLQAVDLDALTDALLACAAFHDQLRFAAGGLSKHIATFKEQNNLKALVKSLGYLVFGGGDYVQRIYDCVYGQEFKVRGFGESSSWELFGWVNREGIPPVNGRVVKALRYLGFNVRV